MWRHLFSGVEISKIQEFGIAFGTSSVDGNVKSAGALWLPLPKTGQMYETVELIGEGHDGWQAHVQITSQVTMHGEQIMQRRTL